MPYIKQDRRPKLDIIILELADAVENEGDLNYAISRLFDLYIHDHKLCYATLNTAIGVLACATQEIYRRVVVGYEEKKMAENGDVFNKGE